jgi:hypothetical protein
MRITTWNEMRMSQIDSAIVCVGAIRRAQADRGLFDARLVNLSPVAVMPKQSVRGVWSGGVGEALILLSVYVYYCSNNIQALH